MRRQKAAEALQRRFGARLGNAIASDLIDLSAG
jgi:hypothetical protein